MVPTASYTTAFSMRPQHYQEMRCSKWQNDHCNWIMKTIKFDFKHPFLLFRFFNPKFFSFMKHLCCVENDKAVTKKNIRLNSDDVFSSFPFFSVDFKSFQSADRNLFIALCCNSIKFNLHTKNGPKLWLLKGCYVSTSFIKLLCGLLIN